MKSTISQPTENEFVIRIVVEGASAPSTSEFQEVGERTPSQRLRLALMHLHNYKSLMNDDYNQSFDEFYQEQITRFVEVVEKGIK